ncbi:hypothetical protein GON09_005167 [Rhodococcus sp. B50]|nr:hypothetical protein [Rhodococcus sp. B50]
MTLAMSDIYTDHEAHGLERAVASLVQQFPQLPETVVRQAVAEAVRAYQGRPIREFIPLFVERRARRALAADSH